MSAMARIAGQAPLANVEHLYRLVIEKTGQGFTTEHAVQQEGVPLREIAGGDWPRA